MKRLLGRSKGIAFADALGQGHRVEEEGDHLVLTQEAVLVGIKDGEDDYETDCKFLKETS